MSKEMVNSPAHYNQSAVECIDAINAALGPDGFVAYCRGNSIKYNWRAGLKNDAIEDLKKAAWYSRMAAGDDPRKDAGYKSNTSIYDGSVVLLRHDLPHLDLTSSGNLQGLGQYIPPAASTSVNDGLEDNLSHLRDDLDSYGKPEPAPEPNRSLREAHARYEEAIANGTLRVQGDHRPLAVVKASARVARLEVELMNATDAFNAAVEDARYEADSYGKATRD